MLNAKDCFVTMKIIITWWDPMYCLTLWRDRTKQSLHSDKDETSSDEQRVRLIIMIITITKQLNFDMLMDVKSFLPRFDWSTHFLFISESNNSDQYYVKWRLTLRIIGVIKWLLNWIWSVHYQQYSPHYYWILQLT